MKNCALCSQKLKNGYNFVLSVNEAGDKELCEKCEQNFNVLINVNKGNKNEIQNAANYFHKLNVYDEVKQHVDEYIKISTATQIAVDEAAKNSKPITIPKSAATQVNKTDDIQTVSPSGWIGLMRVIAWISFGGIIIAGIAMGAMIGSTGEGFLAFVIIVGAIILAFVSIAAEMIFLDMAADTRRIRELLERDKK